MTQENLSICYKHHSFKLAAIILGSIGASTLAGYTALINNSAIRFNKFLELDPTATTMALAATAFFFAIAAIKLMGVLVLPKQSEKVITLTANSITIPVGFFLNEKTKINFRDIQSMKITNFRGRGILGIEFSRGSVKIIADMLPDTETFLFLATFLKEKSGAAFV